VGGKIAIIVYFVEFITTKARQNFTIVSFAVMFISGFAI
jgi:hypothetical protein